MTVAILSKPFSNMGGSWVWHLDIDALGSGGVEGSVSCEIEISEEEDPWTPPTRTFRSHTGSRLLARVKQIWEECTSEQITLSELVEIADGLYSVEPKLGASFSAALLREQFAEIVDEEVPRAVTGRERISQTVQWVGPRETGGGSLGRAMRGHLQQQAISVYVTRRLGATGLLSAGEYDVALTYGPPGTDVDVPVTAFGTRPGIISGTIRVAQDLRDVVVQAQEDRAGAFIVIGGISSNRRRWRDGYPCSKAFTSLLPAIRYYKYRRDRVVADYFRTVPIRNRWPKDYRAWPQIELRILQSPRNHGEHTALGGFGLKFDPRTSDGEQLFETLDFDADRFPELKRNHVRHRAALKRPAHTYQSR